MNDKIPIYEAKISGVDNTGIFAMSFVEYPANEQNFVALKKAREVVKMQMDKQKQVLTGVVLIPDQLIYRYDEQQGEYYIKFTAEDIEKIAAKMMRTGIALSTTTHQHEKNLRGNYLTELWIVKDPKRDKSAALGLGELPAGTLVASYKVTDAYYWKTQVLAGKVRGFSIEGLFNFNTVKMETKKPASKKPAGTKVTGVVALLSAVATMLEGDTVAAVDDLATIAANDTTGSADPELIFELADGSEIHVDSDGFATLDGEQAPAGDHALADGNTITIDDTGMLVITTPDGAAPDPAAATDPVAMAAKKKAAKDKAAAFLAKQNQNDPKAKQIAELRKQIAELEKQPSATPAAAPAPAAATSREALSYTDKMAAVIASRRERIEMRRSGKKPE